MTLAEIPAVVEVCVVAVHVGNAHRSEWAAKQTGLVAFAEKMPEFGIAVASSAPLAVDFHPLPNHHPHPHPQHLFYH